MRLTVEDFMKFRNLIYDKAGMFFAPKKIYFMKKRIEKRMTEKAIDDVMEYYNFLKYKDRAGTELQELLNILTTNETYFFREVNQLNAWSDYCLSEVIEQKRKTGKKIKIWCAGCSTGEEPYSLAVILLKKIPDHSSWNIELIATDIDTTVLEKAKEGIYSERSVRNVTPEQLQGHFLVSPEGFRVRLNLKKVINYKHLNLFDTNKTRMIKNVDFIFCRNVLIYFDDDSRRVVVANFYDSLLKGGYLFLGHSESVSRINTAFNVKRVSGGMIVHQKPLA